MIVAPYEADAQLAYLIREGIADVVITEDSDLLAFGCKQVRIHKTIYHIVSSLLSPFLLQVLFKMNDTGDGKLIELRDIGKANSSLVVRRCSYFCLRILVVIKSCLCRGLLLTHLDTCAYYVVATIFPLYRGWGLARPLN